MQNVADLSTPMPAWVKNWDGKVAGRVSFEKPKLRISDLKFPDKPQILRNAVFEICIYIRFLRFMFYLFID